MRSIRLPRSLGSAVFLALATLSACTSPEDAPLYGTDIITSGTSPAVGELEFPGIFLNSESVLLQYTVNGQLQQKVGVYDASLQRVRFSNLPSGQITVKILVSCSAGQDVVTTVTVTVL